MAEASTIHKYTIKHMNDTGSGIELPVYPEIPEFSDNVVSMSYNNIFATFVDYLLAQKNKTSWNYPYITFDNFKYIYKDYIEAKMILHSNRFFNINHFTADGWVKGLYYFGTPFNYKGIYSESKDGSIAAFEASFHWIEVDGVKFIEDYASLFE